MIKIRFVLLKINLNEILLRIDYSKNFLYYESYWSLSSVVLLLPIKITDDTMLSTKP